MNCFCIRMQETKYGLSFCKSCFKIFNQYSQIRPIRNNLRYELKNKPLFTETVNKCMLCNPFFHILWNFEALEADGVESRIWCYTGNKKWKNLCFGQEANKDLYTFIFSLAWQAML